MYIRLKSAEELHRFNRDAMLMSERIREKLEGIPKDLGRDAKHVCSLITANEILEVLFIVIICTYTINNKE